MSIIIFNPQASLAKDAIVTANATTDAKIGELVEDLDDYGETSESSDSEASDFDDYDDANSSKSQVSRADPFEKWNRFWFETNDILYVHILIPAVTAWQKWVPSGMRSGIATIFENSKFPRRFINSLLQKRPESAFVELGRFCANLSAGFGVINIGKTKKALVKHDPDGEDFAQTLGVWGIGPGPFIVLPLMGPFTLRDGIGFAGDMFSDPLWYIETPFLYTSSAKAVLNFNSMSGMLDSYKQLKEIAIDPYIMMREAYLDLQEQKILR